MANKDAGTEVTPTVAVLCCTIMAASVSTQISWISCHLYSKGERREDLNKTHKNSLLSFETAVGHSVRKTKTNTKFN